MPPFPSLPCPAAVLREIAEEHYKDLSSKPFFPALVEYILSGPVVCMVSAARPSLKLLSLCSTSFRQFATSTLLQQQPEGELSP